MVVLVVVHIGEEEGASHIDTLTWKYSTVQVEKEGLIDNTTVHYNYLYYGIMHMWLSYKGK